MCWGNDQLIIGSIYKSYTLTLDRCAGEQYLDNRLCTLIVNDTLIFGSVYPSFLKQDRFVEKQNIDQSQIV